MLNHQGCIVNTGLGSSESHGVAIPDAWGTEFLRSDNGPEFVAKVVCQWLKESGCQTLFITPHSSLGYLTPAEFAGRYYEKNQVKEVRQPVEKARSLSL